ncbi:uncharacterized protein K02A2.6-like [Macrosteles quadrilineatus]|uniref:uncharacterized protein K02A2.6-like n=1 Tax=Macrosteles quadrilineatus TaxID=74068 RepID=UPI0023E0C5CE|nr:uncharacterized protein K02A2.6-like [Macrosteles quadrilineatus]
MSRKKQKSDREVDEESLSELERKMEKFVFEKYKCEETAEEYIEHFQRVCRVKGLGGSDERSKEARKDLLLAYVGSEPLQKMQNYFIPKNLDSCSYEENKTAFFTLYGPNQTIFAARFEFERAVRNESESFTEYFTRLKKLSKHCRYGQGLDERIRDRFIAGVFNEQFEVEVRHRWPDGVETGGSVVTAERVFQLARSMERARNEVNASTTSNVCFVKKRQTTGQVNGCENCGRYRCVKEKCPAKGQECLKCRKIGHFARVCKRKFVSKIDTKYSDGEHSSDEVESDLHALKKISNRTPRASIRVNVNGLPCLMEFDSGARISTIGQTLWKKLGKPQVKPLSGLTGYGQTPLACLGKCYVSVCLNGETRKLPVAVMEKDDIPLFGLPWMVSFGMKLPPEVSVKSNNVTNDDVNITEEEAQSLVKEFDSVFSDGLGKIEGVKARIHVKKDFPPIALKARRVPFPLKNSVENELNRLVECGVLEKVDPSETAIVWSTPTVNVNKGGGRVRICGDFRVTVNKAIVPEVYQMPTFADLTNKIAGGRLFTVIDLKDAYLQLEVAEEDRNYLIIATHMGYFRYKRLAFGLTDAPAKFQRFMENLLSDIPLVGVNIDDIIVSGRTKEGHLGNVRTVLKRLEAAGIKAKKEKCQLGQNSVYYLGHKIDQDGIHPREDKVKALKEAKTPTNKKELRAFLGAINYYEKFIPHLHGLCSRLHRLTSSKTSWVWNHQEQEEFDRARNLIAEDATVVPYRDDLPITVSCDASEVGVAAIILQTDHDGEERPVAFASRTLQESEKRYSSIDREALACVFGVVKFHQYLYGRHFTFTSDHKPLERIFGKHRDLTKTMNNRLVRWAIFLNNYDFDIKYIEGRNNVLADALSRLPSESDIPSREELSAKLLVQEKIDDMALTSKELQEETRKDETFKRVMMFMESQWPQKLPNDLSYLSPFFHRREELSSVKGILMWGNRIVVPQTLQKKTLRVLHQGHPGIEAMRSLSRFYVWWSKIDEDIETYVKTCNGCQMNHPREPEVPLYSWNVPDGPWERLHLDYAGPFDGWYWLVGVDAFSKWPEISMVRSITAASTVNKLREWFSRYGVPRMIVTDNGTQFTSELFEKFCKDNAIKHACSTPYHPKTNGQVERFIKTFKSRYLSSKGDRQDQTQRLVKLLFAYRNTPQKSTSKPPSELFFGKILRSPLDNLKRTVKDVIAESVFKQKEYHDGKSRRREFSEGEEVWVQREIGAGWTPGVIASRTGELSYQVRVGGLLKRKNADQLRKRSGALSEGGEV